MRHRSEVIARSTAVVAVVLILASVIALKDSILEQWYLYRLEWGDEEDKRQAVKRLEAVGGQKAILKLRECDIQATPCLILRRGLPGQGGTAVDPELQIADSRSTLGTEIHGAVHKIRARIGWETDRAAIVRYMKDCTADARTRVWFAGLWILAVTPDDIFPGPLKECRYDHPMRGTPQYQRYLAEKPDAIAACIDALSSSDRYARGGAAFALSLCGPEASAALPFLKKSINDADAFVSKAAADALDRIPGVLDETRR
jgi:hypothetical protein